MLAPAPILRLRPPSLCPLLLRRASSTHRRIVLGSAGGASMPRTRRPFEARRPPPSAGSPPHHAADGTFCNPWPSYVDLGPREFVTQVLPRLRRLETYALPTVAPEARALAAPRHALQATFLGHVTFLVQAAGWNVLTDPVFSRRCSPVQWWGPARYTPAVAAPADLPPVHVVLISHNHYDHLDFGSIRALLEKEQADVAAGAGAAAAAASGGGARGGGGGGGGVSDAGGSSSSSGASSSSSSSSTFATRPYAGTLWVCPLRVADNLVAAGVSRSRIIELDWWDAFTPRLTAEGALDPEASAGAIGRAPTGDADAPPGAGAGASASASPPSGDAAAPPPPLHPPAPTLVCTPAQHQSARTAWDRNRTLWAGYALLAPLRGGGDVRLYFSGDTGYRAVPVASPPIAPASAEEAALPACPAFAQIGARLGPFDLALLPIGAYSPREFMSSFHASPEDAVAIHADVAARVSVGMHWGTFPLTDEPVEEPPERLRAAVQRAALPPGAFVALKPGGTMVADADGDAAAPLRPEHLVSAPTDAYAAAAVAAAKAPGGIQGVLSLLWGGK